MVRKHFFLVLVLLVKNPRSSRRFLKLRIIVVYQIVRCLVCVELESSTERIFPDRFEQLLFS